MLVALVGWTISRCPISRIGSAPARLKLSSTSASYRAKVSPYGRSSAVQLGQQDLLHPHDGGHRGHGPGVAEPPLPDPGGPLDRVEGQTKRFGHRRQGTGLRGRPGSAAGRAAPARLPGNLVTERYIACLRSM